jgi:hypothetical protein
MATKKSNGTAGKVAAAAAIAGAAAGAYYFLGSSKAKQHRKQVGAWVNKAKKEITSEAKKLSAAAMNEQNYKKIANTVLARYQDAQDLTKREVGELAGMLVKEWKQVKAKAKPAVKKAVKKVTGKRK